MVATSALEMGIEISSVEYVSTTAVIPMQASVFHKLMAASTLVRSRGLADGTEYNVVAVIATSIPLKDTQYTNTSQVYSALTGLLSSSIASGDFSSELQVQSETYQATETSNANATAIVSTTAQVKQKPTYDDDFFTSTSDGELAGIGIGAIVFLILLVVGCLVLKSNMKWWCGGDKTSLLGSERSQRTSQAELSNMMGKL